MKLSSHSRQDFFEINVISLIDVLLTLLMFFVLTTTFVQQTHMNITLPEASSSDRADSPHTLVVGVDREGQYFVGNTQVAGAGIEALKRALQQNAGNQRDMQVLLRADSRTPYQSVVTAMDALGQLGFTHLRVATTSTAGGQGGAD